MKPLQYLHPRRGSKKMPEEKEHTEDSWNRVEQIARISAQFATALGVVGGLLVLVVAVSNSAFASGFREAEGISLENFVNLPLPRFDYRLFGGLNFFAILISGSVVFLGALIWVGILKFLSWILGRFRLIYLFSVIIILYFTLMRISEQPDTRKFEDIMSALLVSTTFWMLRKVLRNYGAQIITSDPLTRISREREPHRVRYWALFFLGLLIKFYFKVGSWIVKLTAKLSSPLFVFFGLVFLFDWLVASVETTAYVSRSIGWAQGVQEVCKSPQVAFDSGFSNEALEQTTFLLLRTDAEYYVFTTTIDVTLPPPSANIKQFVAPLMHSLPLTQGCSPANLFVIPAPSVGGVTVTYNEQVKPGACCYRLPGLPILTPAPTPDAP